MFEHALFYELLYRNGGGYRCPRCYSFHGYADGFGMSRCHTCGTYFSVLTDESQVKTTVKNLLSKLHTWVKKQVVNFRGKRCDDRT